MRGGGSISTSLLRTLVARSAEHCGRRAQPIAAAPLRFPPPSSSTSPSSYPYPACASDPAPAAGRQPHAQRTSPGPPIITHRRTLFAPAPPCYSHLPSSGGTSRIISRQATMSTAAAWDGSGTQEELMYRDECILVVSESPQTPKKQNPGGPKTPPHPHQGKLRVPTCLARPRYRDAWTPSR